MDLMNSLWGIERDNDSLLTWLTGDPPCGCTAPIAVKDMIDWMVLFPLELTKTVPIEEIGISAAYGGVSFGRAICISSALINLLLIYTYHTYILNLLGATGTVGM